jgi:hypothetical protein
MINLTDEEFASLTVAANNHDRDAWNTACNAIKLARDGQYPPDWYHRVLASGLPEKLDGMRVVCMGVR